MSRGSDNNAGGIVPVSLFVPKSKYLQDNQAATRNTLHTSSHSTLGEAEYLQDSESVSRFTYVSVADIDVNGSGTVPVNKLVASASSTNRDMPDKKPREPLSWLPAATKMLHVHTTGWRFSKTHSCTTHHPSAPPLTLSHQGYSTLTAHWT